MIELTAYIEAVRVSSEEKESQAKSTVSFRFNTPTFNSLTLLVNAEQAREYARMMAEGKELVFKMQSSDTIPAPPDSDMWRVV